MLKHNSSQFCSTQTFRARTENMLYTMIEITPLLYKPDTNFEVVSKGHNWAIGLESSHRMLNFTIGLMTENHRNSWVGLIGQSCRRPNIEETTGYCNRN